MPRPTLGESPSVRVQIVMTADEQAAVQRYWHRHRLSSFSAAIRHLCSAAQVEQHVLRTGGHAPLPWSVRYTDDEGGGEDVSIVDAGGDHVVDLDVFCGHIGKKLDAAAFIVEAVNEYRAPEPNARPVNAQDPTPELAEHEGKRENRIPFMASDAELEAIDEWRFANRVATRSRAIRTLCALALRDRATAREMREVA